MKNFKWEPKYTVIAIYAFLVIAASLLFATFLFNFGSLWSFAGVIVKYLIPFVYAFGIAFILNPLLRVFEKCLCWKKLSAKMRRTFALLFTYLTALLLLVLFFAVVSPALIESVTALGKNIATYSSQADTWVAEMLTLIPFENVQQWIAQMVEQVIAWVTGFLMSFLQNAITVTGQVTSGVVNVIMGIIISIYMLANKEMLIAQCKRMLHALLPEKFVIRLVDVAHDSNVKFSGFLVGKLIDSIIIGIICAIGMIILKMPFVTLVSLIIGVTNIIPYFGPFIGAIPGIILVFIGAGWGPALIFAIFILVLQQFDGNILGPAILGQSTGLDSMWVIFAILLFGGLYGFVGMIIGVPLLAVIFGLIQDFLNNQLKKKGLDEELDSYASEKHKLISTKRSK